MQCVVLTITLRQLSVDSSPNSLSVWPCFHLTVAEIIAVKKTRGELMLQTQWSPVTFVQSPSDCSVLRDNSSSVRRGSSPVAEMGDTLEFSDIYQEVKGSWVSILIRQLSPCTHTHTHAGIHWYIFITGCVFECSRVMFKMKRDPVNYSWFF